MDASDWQHLVITLIALIVLVLAGCVLTLSGQTSNQKLIPKDDKPNGRGHRSLANYLNSRRSLAGAMRLLELLATVIAASELSALMGDRIFDWVSIVFVVLIYLIFGRAIPRAIASRQLSDARLSRMFGLGRMGETLLTPLIWIETTIADGLAKLLPGEPIDDRAVGTEDELKLRVLETDDGVIGEIERQMIDGILSLEEMTVRDVMVPRLDVVALDRRARATDVIDTIRESGHSRLPVYQENLDRILGVLYVKDLLPYVIGNTTRLPLLDLIRPAYVVPESKKLPELFADLKRMRIHLAIVTDEYGGTAGLVTIEDILEEIVGEIQDEYDSEEEMMVDSGNGVVVADGRLPLEDLAEFLDVDFEEEEDFSTLGGFVHKHLGRLAVAGDTFEAEGVRVEILSVERHRVRKMRVTRLALPEPEPEEEEQESWLQRLRSDSDDKKEKADEKESEQDES
ncbi:MAG: HlyC/CorC family transporter [Thermomicrobiales bacterium]|nr:HlyC/CorC family transporter [Thermomicrobiales bacterium]